MDAEATASCLQFWLTGSFPSAFNDIFIVLIPKVNMGQLLPISLGNVLYKIVAKVLANCLKLIFSDLVDRVGICKACRIMQR